MENSDKDMLLLQSLSRTQSLDLNTEVNSEPQEQQVESEPDTQPISNQEKPESRIGPSTLARIEFRIEQLHNRRFLLQKTQSFRTKAGYNSGSTTEETTCEENDEVCELKAIQRELKELLVKKEELEKEGNSTDITLNGKQKEHLSSLYTTETPCGGIYILPPPKLHQEVITLEQIIKTEPTAEIPIDDIVPVNNLGQTSGVTRCPVCEEIVSTETSTSVSDAAWLLCCLCAMMGCVAGCCLIPFFRNSLKKVSHQCPRCWAHIHTYQPF